MATLGRAFIDIPALKDSIIGQESGGNAGAVNPHSGALGLGQVMPENLAGEGSGWDYDALGRDITPAEFLASPKLQDEIIEHQLGAIARKKDDKPSDFLSLKCHLAFNHAGFSHLST